MKIATWNVNSLRVRLPQVLDWLAATQPEVLALQETKLPDEEFPVAAFQEAGYEASFSGQKTYNGVALVSRTAAQSVIREVPSLEDPQRRVIAGTVQGVRVINLYVVNGAEVGSDKFSYKLDWLEKVTAFVSDQLREFPQLVVLGDFNIAPDDRDVYDPELCRERILCSTPERQALRRLLELGLVDTFRLFEQEPESFSWWDYRAAAFRRNMGLRIDLILANESMARRCTACRIDKGPRALPRPSDHAPVIATFRDDTR